MWFHGLWIKEAQKISTQPDARAWLNKNGYIQYSQLAESIDGINFSVTPNLTKESYLRVFHYKGYFYALGRLGRLLRTKNLYDSFELGPNPFKETSYADRVRHVALELKGKTLYVYFSAMGDEPEHIVMSTINLSEDWTQWKSSEPIKVLEPEKSYECAKLPIQRSIEGLAHQKVRALRDPFIFKENKSTFLFYSICGEQGIAAAKLTVTKP